MTVPRDLINDDVSQSDQLNSLVPWQLAPANASNLKSTTDKVHSILQQIWKRLESADPELYIAIEAPESNLLWCPYGALELREQGGEEVLFVYSNDKVPFETAKHFLQCLFEIREICSIPVSLNRLATLDSDAKIKYRFKSSKPKDLKNPAYARAFLNWLIAARWWGQEENENTYAKVTAGFLNTRKEGSPWGTPIDPNAMIDGDVVRTAIEVAKHYESEVAFVNTYGGRSWDYTAIDGIERVLSCWTEREYENYAAEAVDEKQWEWLMWDFPEIEGAQEEFLEEGYV